MADDKRGRDKQARDADKRQREREMAAEMERMDEPEPSIDEEDLAELETELEPLSYPTTGAEVVAAVGDHEIESAAGTYTIEELVPDTDEERFESPGTVRVRVERPTVAAVIKRIVEACEGIPDANLRGSQRSGYERTFRELKAIDAVDEDEGIQVIGDWIVEQIHDNEQLPGSRAVRRQSAKFCRKNGYRVRKDEWLGI